MRKIFLILALQVKIISYSQLSEFKMMVGCSEVQIKNSVKNQVAFFESYSEGGKTLMYTYSEFDVMYAIKSNKMCSKIWIIFKNPNNTSQMNKWYFDNGYSSRRDYQSGEFEWKKSITTKQVISGKSNEIIEVTSAKIDSQTFFFANKLETLLGY